MHVDQVSVLKGEEGTGSREGRYGQHFATLPFLVHFLPFFLCEPPRGGVVHQDSITVVGENQEICTLGQQVWRNSFGAKSASVG